MKIKLRLLTALKIVLVMLLNLLAACPYPKPGTPEPGSEPEAHLRFKYYIDPYPVPGKPFTLCILINMANGSLGAYDFIITYNSLKMIPDLTGGFPAVCPGSAGFMENFDASTPGCIRITGTNENGMEPGMGLQFLLTNWIAVYPGPGALTLIINQLLTPAGAEIRSQPLVKYTVLIEEAAYFPLTGLVLDSIGGAPVADAVVEIAGSGQTVNTDQDGIFRFEDILTGVYDIIASKPGKAGSKLAQVPVNGKQSAVEIVLPKYAHSPLATTPPAIVLRGVERDDEYTGSIPIDVFVAPGSCAVTATEFHRSIYLKIGSTTRSYYEVADSKNTELSYLWNTSFLPPGSANIKVVAYDNNNNRSELNLPVVIADNTGKVPGVAPLDDYYTIIAYTYGESLNIMRTIPGSPAASAPQPGSSRAQADSTVYVEFSARKYYNGIAVYKSHTRYGVYNLAGETKYSDSGEYKFIDYAPDLAPGTTVFYKLAYFNQYGTGPLTEALSVRILPKYNLFLTGPAHNAVITNPAPVLRWTCTPFLDDAQRTDWINVRNILDSTIIAYSFVINETEFQLPALLYNNKYEWDIRSYYEYVNSKEKANVLSQSFPRGRGATDFSMNGAFAFTVIQ